MPSTNQYELQRLLEFTERVGSDPLLTQASTGNSSAKLDDVLWIKASGKWMADALRDDIFIPLNLREIVADCLRQGVDPATRHPSASLETAMHAALPHRVVLHVHSVNTIAWAVRKDADIQLKSRLEGLRWRLVPYSASGLPLSREIEGVLSAHPHTDVFVLANHGLVIGAQDAGELEYLLAEVERRLAISPRRAHPADYSLLAEICTDSQWDLPDDDEVHALGTDTLSQAILGAGLLYPCQAIFSGCRTPRLFRPVPCPDAGDYRLSRYESRPFVIVEGRGVVINRSATAAEIAMLCGLTQVVQRLSASAPVRYLSEADLDGITGEVACRYREIASANQSASVH
jgi:rhamnose utilization protein RhaD (predicted bifunctional aldolase and dehydrogenase)